MFWGSQTYSPIVWGKATVFKRVYMKILAANSLEWGGFSVSRGNWEDKDAEEL
jgi:hypothetical protein